MILYIGAFEKSAYDPLAQMVEHMTFNHGVRSSTLRWITINLGVAQLGARYLGVVEAAGSSPVTQTKRK